MTLPPNSAGNELPGDEDAPEEEGPLDESMDETIDETIDGEDLSRLMESTVDSIEEVLDQQPRISSGGFDGQVDAGETDAEIDRASIGESTMPFGIDLTQDVDKSQLESTHRIEQPVSESGDVSESGKSSSPHQDDSHRPDSGKTVRLEDTADQNAIDATLQLDSGSVPAPIVSGGTGTIELENVDDDVSVDGGTVVRESASSIDKSDIGQTVNPRELSGEDAAFWGSLLQSGTGKISSVGNRGEVTKVTPAIERTISETNLQIRVRDMVTPKQPADAESDYRLVRLLGKGGMGNVFVAKQSSLDRLVAVKVIKPLEKKRRDKLAKDGRLDEVEEDRRQQFLSEAVVTGDLDHPNIVPIHDIAVTADNTLFYAMKRVVGTPWSKVIDEKSRDENLDILLKTADAIGFAHTRGVVHRDIKPENIMLGDFGVVLVMDWGLALAQPEFEKIESISHTAGLGGTPAFMAPEMATGPMEKIGPCSDIYLLGATLFLIITGRPPHQAPNITQCIKAVAKNEITGDIESYSGELMNIALRAMAKEPANRFADVTAFQQAIREYRAHAESIALASRADLDAQQGALEQDYTLFSRATYGYEQAISLWQGNEPARDGLRKTKLTHARSAYENEDFDLGISLLNTDDPEHDELIKLLREGQRERELRQSRLALFKRVAVAMLAFIIVGGAIAFYFINDQRNKAITASEIASKQTNLANKATRRVEEEKENVLKQKEIADQATKKAKDNLIVANQQKKEANDQRAEANRQRADAVKSREAAIASERVAKQKEQEAIASEAKAEKQRLLAVKNADEALREKENAEYEVYLSQIGLAKARIERNEFDDARRILRDAKSKRGVARLGWEWRWLWRQANQSIADKQTPASIIDLSLRDDGSTGVIVLESGGIERVKVDGKGDLETDPVKQRWSQKATSAAVSPDGRFIAVGFLSGDIELWDRDLAKQLGRLNKHEQTVTDLQFAGNERLISASLDRTVRVWNSRNPRLEETLWHIAPVRNVAVARPRNQLLIAAAVADRSSGRAVLWQMSDGVVEEGQSKRSAKRLGEFSRNGRPLASIALSPNGALAATGDIEGNIFLWATNAARRTDYKNAVATAIGKISGKVTTAEYSGGESNKFARLIDPKLRARVVENSQERLVSTRTNVSASAKAHDDLVASISFSRDGKSLLSTAHDYTIKVWDTDSRDLRKTLRGHGGWVIDALFVGNDAGRVVSVSKDASVRSWDTDVAGEDLTLIKRQRDDDEEDSSAQPHSDEILSARFDPSGQRVVSASLDHTARVLEIEPENMTFREIANLEMNDSDESKDQLSEGTAFRAMSAAVDRANGHLFVGSADATVRIWDVSRGTQLGKLTGTGLNRALAVSANGRLVLTGSSSPETKAILWGIDPTGVKSPKILYRLKGHEEAVTALAISPDGRTLFTGDRIGVGYLWDTATGQRRAKRIEDARGFRINDASFSPDGTELLMVSDDQFLTRVDSKTGRRLSRLGHDGFVTQVSISDDGRRVLTISESSTKREFRSVVTLWDLQRGTRRIVDRITSRASNQLQGDQSKTGKKSKLRTDRFLSARFGTQSDRMIVSRAGADGQSSRLTLVDLFENANGKQRRLQMPARLGPAEVALPLPGNHLLTLNGDAAFLWDLETMTHRKSYRSHAAVIQASFSFDGRFIATGSRSLKIWDARTGASVGKLESPHRGVVRSVHFCPRGPDYLLATAGEDGFARVWKWEPKEKTFIQTHQFALADRTPVVATAVCFSDDGEWLLVAGEAGKAKAIALAGKGEAIAFGHPAEPSFTCADFSRDGKWVVLGSDDKKARLYNIDRAANTASEPIVLEGHADQIEDVAIIQDASREMRVLTASQDKSVRLWDPRIGTQQTMGRKAARKMAREMLTIRKHTMGVTAVDVTSDGNLVLTASRDGSVILWPAAASDSFNVFDDLPQTK